MGRFGVLLDVADRFQEMFGSDLDRFGGIFEAIASLTASRAASLVACSISAPENSSIMAASLSSRTSSAMGIRVKNLLKMAVRPSFFG